MGGGGVASEFDPPAILGLAEDGFTITPGLAAQSEPLYLRARPALWPKRHSRSERTHLKDIS